MTNQPNPQSELREKQCKCHCHVSTATGFIVTTHTSVGCEHCQPDKVSDSIGRGGDDYETSVPER